MNKNYLERNKKKYNKTYCVLELRRRNTEYKFGDGIVFGHIYILIQDRYIVSKLCECHY